ncbi:MAG: hypothetical protein Q8N21_00825 [bacterium]|nr:hypothetical protein [bacterium]
MIIPEMGQKIFCEKGQGEIVSINFDRETCVVALRKPKNKKVEILFHQIETTEEKRK